MSVRAQTEYGMLEGRHEDGVDVYRNVPYAAPPFGSNRYRPPVPPAAWDGIRDAGTAGVGPYQPVSDNVEGLDVDAVYANPKLVGEDCLTLEVWTPKTQAAGLPVMVWIHGGGFMFGAGSSPAYWGRSFARDGVVHVSINYRLGVEGFMYLGEGTDNLGLRDQVFALEWVKRNIAAFGGDPGNVTIFGQSAGSVSVMALLAMPSARGLFARAIAESGSPFVCCDAAEATVWTRRMAKRLGVAPTRDGFASVAIERTTAETLPLAFDFANPVKRGAKAFRVSPYQPVYGTPTLPEPLIVAAASPSVPLMTGSARNETTGFLKVLKQLDHINPLIALVFTRLLRVNGRIRRAYRESPRHITGGVRLVEASWTDFGLRMPTIGLAETRMDPTWLYEFHWETPSLPAGLGAFHSLENSFVRDDFAALRGVGQAGTELLGDNPPQALADAMHGAWLGFARTGDPGWPVYEPTTRQTMVFDTVSAVVPDAASPEREAWAGRFDGAEQVAKAHRAGESDGSASAEVHADALTGRG